MPKKLIVSLICLIIILVALFSRRENDSLSFVGDRLISAMHQSPTAVAVFNMDKGVFV